MKNRRPKTKPSASADSPAIEMIHEMIRANLELAFDHLLNGDDSLAEHELLEALEKVGQIKVIKNPLLRPPVRRALSAGDVVLAEIAETAEADSTLPASTSPHEPETTSPGVGTPVQRNR